MTREQIIAHIKNRQREFRVWVPEESIMLYPPSDNGDIIWSASDINGTPIVCLLDEDRRGEPFSYVPEQVLMDFTGQLDVNGKKIFEGDIIRWYGNYSRYTYTGVVIYKDGNFLLACKNSSGYYEEIPIATISGNVIGNIFENPELLAEI